jgi:hypothetical protein
LAIPGKIWKEKANDATRKQEIITRMIFILQIPHSFFIIIFFFAQDSNLKLYATVDRTKLVLMSTEMYTGG